MSYAHSEKFASKTIKSKIIENEDEKKHRMAIEQSSMFFESVFRELIETAEMESNIGREFSHGKRDSTNIDTNRQYSFSSPMSQTEPLWSPQSIQNVSIEDCFKGEQKANDSILDEHEVNDSYQDEHKSNYSP